MLADDRVHVRMRDQRHIARLVVHKLKVEPSGGEEQRHAHLLHGDGLSWARAQPTLEWAERVAVYGGGGVQEAIGVETFSPREDGIVVMYVVYVYSETVTLGRVRLAFVSDGVPEKLVNKEAAWCI